MKPPRIKRSVIVAAMMFRSLVCFPANADEGALKGVTMKECYALALKRSETVAIQQEVIKEAQGRFQQSLSTILPQVSFVDSEKWQDGSKSSDSTSSMRHIPQRQFVFTQPLFSGFKEFAAIAASKAERRQRKQELIRAQQLLFTDVSDAFYLFKSFEEDLKIVDGTRKALLDRIDELKKREALGRSRTSEVASAEAKLYQTDADMESVRSQEEVTRELLEFLVGKKIDSLSDEDFTVSGLASEDEYLGMVDNRPDVRAADEAYKVAEKEITIARAGYFPTVDAVGDYYTKRVGSSSDVDWDAMLTVSVPIFTGGLTPGLVKEARAKAEEARLNLSRIRREAALDVQNSYTKLTANQRQTDAFKKAVDASQKNYDLQAADYRNNLVNNLDVLQALEDLQTEQRSYNLVKNATQRSYWALKVATGDISDDTL